MIKRFAVFTIIWVSISLNLDAQALKHVQGDVIVQLEKGVSPSSITSLLTVFEGEKSQLEIKKMVVKPLNIWVLSFDYSKIDENKFISTLNQAPGVLVAQFNHLVTMRETYPTDPRFNEQWQYFNTGANGGVVDADLDAELAWDIATGGVTPDGDTIVAAVLDDGIDLNHEDFEDNRWVNHAEIRGNGLDDDNNGYVDDYQGWSIVTNNDNVAGGGHGTPVAGIIGAKANNGKGVVGVNWNVKVMVVKNNFNTNEAAVIEAYAYPLAMRQLYNDTDGAKGAFVVSTNASWGTDYGDPEDSPIWCDFYDTMGAAGIIGCGATINGNVNVDIEGDLPTACPSDYLISVTNMNRSDNKVTGAGYGVETIDLGSFGAGAFTTANGNSYDGFGGTSGATPHVTGLVALLYSAPCGNLIALAKSDPGVAALMVKRYILEGVDPNASLQGITTTGGRMNMFNSLEMLMNNCGACPPSTSLDARTIGAESASLSWNNSNDTSTFDLRWRLIGSTSWTDVIDVSSPYNLEGLSSCTEYEFQINSNCSDTISGYSNSHVFETDGCCRVPENISFSPIVSNATMVSWPSVLAAESYNLQITTSEGTEEIMAITDTSYLISDLAACENYEVSIQILCQGETTPYSTVYSLETPGCGACLDFDYCELESDDADGEWIESVTLNTLNNVSGSNGGYGDFTGNSDHTTILNQGAIYDIILTPGFGGGSFGEYFRVWIDYNGDGDFEDADEQVFDSGDPVNTPQMDQFFVPITATPGVTKMRVSMKWLGAFGSPQDPCDGSYDFGEVEDYCITIQGLSIACAPPLQVALTDIGEEFVDISWVSSMPGGNFLYRYKELTASTWTEATVMNNSVTIDNLTECTDYVFEVAQICPDTVSSFSATYNFKSDCINSTHILESFGAFDVNPNPFQNTITISSELNTRESVRIELIDINGRILNTINEEYSIGQHSIQLTNLDQLAQGIYILKVSIGDEYFTNKLLKQ